MPLLVALDSEMGGLGHETAGYNVRISGKEL